MLELDPDRARTTTVRETSSRRVGGALINFVGEKSSVLRGRTVKAFATFCSLFCWDATAQNGGQDLLTFAHNSPVERSSLYGKDGDL